MSYSEQIQANVNKISTDPSTNITSEDNKLTTDFNIDDASYVQYNNQTGYKYNNKYYYNSLNQYSKVIYDTIINNLDKLKTGNGVIDINYDFSKVWNNANGQSDLNEYYDDAINALNLDVPDLFYIDFSKMYLNVEKTSNFFSTKYKLYISPGKYPNYYIDGYESRQQVELAIQQVEAAKSKLKSKVIGNDYSKLKILHDWLVDYMSYDGTSSNKATVYGALIEKKGVCESYARAYKYILDECGIENILVTGTATNSTNNTEDHMWNYVKLNGKWYAVDVTWDDPIVIGGGTVGNDVKQKYFLNGSREFFKNHTEKLTISSSNKIFALPKLEVNNY